MLDTHKIVYVVSFMPSFEGATVGGFDWYAEPDAARDALIAHVQGDSGRRSNEDWTHDYTIRSMPVPKDLTNVQITELLDTELRDMRELPLPAEWEQIRNLGGAIDFTDNTDDKE